VKRVEVPLTFDAEFFDILLDDLSSLDTLQSNEQKILSDEIEALSTEVIAVTKYESPLQLLIAYIHTVTDSECLDARSSRRQICTGGES
jgi:hypothetical protein